MSLRNKILSGFLILVLMLAIAGAWSIYHFQFIGNRINKMIEKEYKTVNSAIVMLHALEREDSAILLSLLGNLRESSIILVKADSTFLSGLAQAKESILNDDQRVLIDEIEKNYSLFKNTWNNLTMSSSSEEMLQSYFDDTHIEFLMVNNAIEKLLLANEKAIYNTTTTLKDLANRATMPGIIAIIAALIFTIMFSYFVYFYFISPLNKINKAVKNYKKSGGKINIKVNSNDEIGELAENVNYLSKQIDKTK